jgi:hypothetical protein
VRSTAAAATRWWIAGIVNLPRLVDAAIEAGHVPPMLVVFVNGLRMGTHVDWKSVSVSMEAKVVRDLVGHIDATCRTIAAREGRLLDGFSMGVVARRAWASSIPNCSAPSRSWAPGRRRRRSPARQGPASSGPRSR